MRFDDYSYERVAWLYDGLARLYSRGRIGRSKRAHLSALKPGERVLFVGVGEGEEALEAVRQGCVVTAIDLSPRMLGRFARRLSDAGLEACLIEGDAARHVPDGAYDAVVAHYFLNLYSAEAAGAMLRQLADWTVPGGYVLLADFALAEGGALAKAMTELYYRPVNWIAWALGFCALHPIPDLPQSVADAGLRLEKQARFPVAWGAHPAFLAVLARVP